MTTNGDSTSREARRRRVAREYELLALEMFATSGYQNVTLDDIAAAAGISTRTLFRYFPTKDDLLLARTRRSSLELREALMAVDPTSDPVAAIWDAYVGLTAKHAEDLGRVLLWHRAAASAPGVLARASGEGKAMISDLITKICADSLGWDLQGDIRPRVVGSAIAGALAEVFTYWVERGGQDDLQSLYRASFEAVQSAFLLRGAAPAPSAPPGSPLPLASGSPDGR